MSARFAKTNISAILITGIFRLEASMSRLETLLGVLFFSCLIGLTAVVFPFVVAALWLRKTMRWGSTQIFASNRPCVISPALSNSPAMPTLLLTEEMAAIARRSGVCRAQLVIKGYFATNAEEVKSRLH